MDFVYMNEDSIYSVLKCKLCSKPFIDPVMITEDGERFCRLCIIQKLSNNHSPDDDQDDQESAYIKNLIPMKEKVVLDMLDNLLVKCNTCQEINIRRIEFQQHLITECSKRIVLCNACDLKCPWSGLYDEYDDHVKQCTFELLRPILNETFQCQKQLEQYRTCYNEQQNEIVQLKEQIEQHENRTEKLEKGFKAFLEIISRQKFRHEKFQNDIQEIQEQLTEQNHRQNQLRDEIQQIKEQSNQTCDLFHKFQQSTTELPNENQQQSKQFQNEIQQIKEQFNQYDLEIKKFQEQDLNHENQIKQLQKQDLHRKDELMHIRQISDQHQVQIYLLARKKCVLPIPAKFNDTRIGEFIETFKPNSEINLDGKHFDTQDMEFICKAAIVDKQCRNLRLENNDITAKGITVLADTLYGNTTLVELHLSNNSISDMGVHALAQVLSINNHTLEWLEIHSNKITDEGAEYLAEMLKTNKKLTRLGLCFNQITDCGVRLLATAITCYNETLQSLHLASNQSITDGSVDKLVEMLTHNRSLRGLWLTDCSLSTDAAKKLKQVVQSNKNFILEI